MTTITERLACFAVSRTLDFPQGLIEKARDAFVDSLGVAVGGISDPTCHIAYGSVAKTVAAKSAYWARGTKGTAEDAAFVNSIQIHVLDFDDSALSLRGHPSSTMMSTAIAVGQEVGASGVEAMQAYAVGLQVATRVAKWLTPKHYLNGWHTTVTAGIFGCTAIAARLLKLDEKQMRNAFGLAASQAGGLTRNFGSMAKSFHTGHASRCAIITAKLASAGMTADENIFDGPKGFLALYSGAPNDVDASLADDLGKVWELLDPGIYVKKWACCYAIHRPVAGLLELQAKAGFNASQVRSVSVGFLPGAAHPLNHFDPKNGLQAKFSIEYCVAAALVHGSIGVEVFEDEFVLREDLQAFQKKVHRFELPHSGVFNGLTGYNDLVVDTDLGRFEYRIDRTPGSPDWPLTPAEQDRKFLECAQAEIGEQRALEFLARAKGILALPDISVLFD